MSEKKVLYIGGGIAALVLGYLIYRHEKSIAAAGANNADAQNAAAMEALAVSQLPSATLSEIGGGAGGGASLTGVPSDNLLSQIVNALYPPPADTGSGTSTAGGTTGGASTSGGGSTGTVSVRPRFPSIPVYPIGPEPVFGSGSGSGISVLQPVSGGSTSAPAPLPVAPSAPIISGPTTFQPIAKPIMVPITVDSPYGH